MTVYVSDWYHVDGRYLAPVDMDNLLLVTGFYTSQVVSRISTINSIMLLHTWSGPPQLLTWAPPTPVKSSGFASKKHRREPPSSRWKVKEIPQKKTI